jgi:tetratricopeptide (TPR) repeat protein
MNRRRHSKTRTNRHDAAPRRRIVLNVRLLVASTVIIGLTLAFGFVIYRYQYGKLADAFLQRASSALADSEWSKAAAYFEKVLSMRPNDSETLRGWAESLSKGADSPAKRARLKTVLYRVLGRQPSNDIRLKLAENLYALGDYAAAIIEAQEVFKAVEHRSAAQRIIALSLYASSRESGTRVTHEQAATALKSAVEAIPSDVDLAVTTATLMRTQPSAFTLTASEASKAADVVINRMIELNPSNVEALLARYQYRESFKLPKAKSDLDAAVEVSPTHYVALLLSANAALHPHQPSRSPRLSVASAVAGKARASRSGDRDIN